MTSASITGTFGCKRFSNPAKEAKEATAIARSPYEVARCRDTSGSGFEPPNPSPPDCATEAESESLCPCAPITPMLLVRQLATALTFSRSPSSFSKLNPPSLPPSIYTSSICLQRQRSHHLVFLSQSRGLSIHRSSLFLLDLLPTAERRPYG